MTVRNDEKTELQSRVDELEERLAQIQQLDDIREVELRSLQRDVALKSAYIEKLERMQEEIVAPKDVHIRNLEAIISQLQGITSPTDFRGNTQPVAQKSRISRLNRRRQS